MALITTPSDAEADAYISLVAFKAYCDKHGHAFPDDDDTAIEQAIRRATVAIDAKYRPRFPGEVSDVGQALEWPRKDVCFRGETLASDTIPAQVERATAEAAVREIAEPGALTPDLERGGRVKSTADAVGSIETSVEYMDSAPTGTTFTVIDGIIAPLLRPRTFELARA